VFRPSGAPPHRTTLFHERYIRNVTIITAIERVRNGVYDRQISWIFIIIISVRGNRVHGYFFNEFRPPATVQRAKKPFCVDRDGSKHFIIIIIIVIVIIRHARRVRGVVTWREAARPRYARLSSTIAIDFPGSPSLPPRRVPSSTCFFSWKRILPRPIRLFRLIRVHTTNKIRRKRIWKKKKILTIKNALISRQIPDVLRRFETKTTRFSKKKKKFRGEHPRNDVLSLVRLEDAAAYLITSCFTIGVHDSCLERTTSCVPFRRAQ